MNRILSSSDWVALAWFRLRFVRSFVSCTTVSGRLKVRRVRSWAPAAPRAGTGSFGRSDIFVLSALPEVFER